MPHSKMIAVRIIVNGKAAADPALREAVAAMRELGCSIEIRVTWEFGDAARFASEAVREGVNTLVAAGGDGTVNEVVNGMLQASEEPETALGILPYGTANDFATSCNIPKGDPLAALKVVLKGTARRVDVGVVNDRYFINVATGGFGAEVTAATPPDMKRALGGAAYSLMGLITALKMTAWQCRLTIGNEQRKGAMIVLAVGNGRQAGGGYQLAPHAILDDGLLDLMVVHDVDLPRFGVLLDELTDLRNPDNAFVHYRRLSTFSLESEDPLQLNLDGEPIRSHRFDFSVLPRCISLILPAEAQHLFTESETEPE